MFILVFIWGHLHLFTSIQNAQFHVTIIGKGLSFQMAAQTVTFYTVYKKLMYLQAFRAHLSKIPTML